MTWVREIRQFAGQFSIARGRWLSNSIDYARAARFLIKS
jgi:hypothetical protein